MLMVPTNDYRFSEKYGFNNTSHGCQVYSSKEICKADFSNYQDYGRPTVYQNCLFHF